MLFSAEVRPAGQVRFRFFAPAADAVQLALEGQQAQSMQNLGHGWHELVLAAEPGARYRFGLPGGQAVPDPVSRFQPEDVDGPSEVIDPAAYTWQDDAWAGRPWPQTVLYELHVGTFTPEGTFRAAAAKLDHLAACGITGVELMCIADFPGSRNWGYDSVLWFAPDATYGRPDDLKAFVDAAHARGIQVILDVVYNHFGPQGNYLPSYFPQLLTKEHCTPWGDALNFGHKGDDPAANNCSKQVRELLIQNALYWVREFHIDGLRLDAAHAIIDESPLHVLDEMALRVHELARSFDPPRHVHLIREDEQNISDKLLRNEAGHCEKFTAQWNHDMSHLLGAAMRQDFAGDEHDAETVKQAEALAEGFVIAAEESGEQEKVLCKVPPTAFVAFVQTHDLIGNRIGGERIHALASAEAIRAVLALLLLGPQIPMLFMGDEFGASTPFPYFCDFGGELGRKVSEGRREFLQKLTDASEEDLKRAPDPQAEATFLSAKLRWEEMEESPWPGWYASILGVRLQHVAPLLQGVSARCGKFRILRPGAFEVLWTLGDKRLQVQANLRPDTGGGFADAGGEQIWLEGSAQSAELGPWSVRWMVV